MKNRGSIKSKPAICEKCGKRLLGQVPADATDIICFACVNKEPRPKRPIKDKT